MDFKLPTVLPSPQACFSRGGQFPQEILAEFAEYLPVKCLLNLSLTSSSLRKEAQRVLFRAIDHIRFQEHPASGYDRETHRLFLSAIINAPTRLGPHVHTYTSRFLAVVPAHSDEYDEQDLFQSTDNYWVASCELWNLTSRALPLLTQLKHLRLFLNTDWTYVRKGSEPSPFRGTSILRRCNFTLDSFSWGETHGLQNGISDLDEFLSRQPNLQLLHLNTIHRSRWYTDDVPQLQLARNMLPCLQRMIGPPYLLFTLLSESRPINTVFWHEPWSPVIPMLAEDAEKGLQRVKCLSLSDIGTLVILCSSLSSVKTLYLKQVPTSFHEYMSVLTHLKSLCVLILEVDSWHIESLNSGDPAHSTPQTNPALRLAATAFEIHANTLQIVHFPLQRSGVYEMLSVDKTGQLQVQQCRDLVDIIQPLQPWIPGDQSLWAGVEDYLS